MTIVSVVFFILTSFIFVRKQKFKVYKPKRVESPPLQSLSPSIIGEAFENAGKNSKGRRIVKTKIGSKDVILLNHFEDLLEAERVQGIQNLPCLTLEAVLNSKEKSWTKVIEREILLETIISNVFQKSETLFMEEDARISKDIMEKLMTGPDLSVKHELFHQHFWTYLMKETPSSNCAAPGDNSMSELVIEEASGSQLIRSWVQAALDKAERHMPFCEQRVYLENKPYFESAFEAGLTNTIDAAVSSLDWLLLYLSQYPELQDQIRANKPLKTGQAPLLETFMDEVLRIKPTSALGFYYAAEKFELNEFVIKKNQLLIANYWAFNQDPSAWDSPGSFQPDRLPKVPQTPKFSSDYSFNTWMRAQVYSAATQIVQSFIVSPGRQWNVSELSGTIVNCSDFPVNFVPIGNTNFTRL